MKRGSIRPDRLVFLPTASAHGTGGEGYARGRHVGDFQRLAIRGEPILFPAPLFLRLRSFLSGFHPKSNFPAIAFDLSGHANPALGFHIDGLALRILVIGDLS